MPPQEIVADEKEVASLTLGKMAKETVGFFPYEKYRAGKLHDRPLNTRHLVYPGEHGMTSNSDGIGTKPELAERLADFLANPAFFRTLAFDVFAMVVDDAARVGAFVPAVYNNLDVNAADPQVIEQLALGIYDACKAGKFGLLDGETAELGHRTPGFGKTHLNWNATAMQIAPVGKIIDGSNLKAGQIVVAMREETLRSNGFTSARAIMQLAYLKNVANVQSHREYVLQNLLRCAPELTGDSLERITNDPLFAAALKDHVYAPWHTAHPELTKKLLLPSTIYAPVIYEAQGGIDGEIKIPIVAAAHVSGGGIPTKGDRMLQHTDLGLRLDTVFPDAAGVEELIELAQIHGFQKKPGQAFTQRIASQEWNRGVGFMTVFETRQHADEFVALSNSMGKEAAVAGEITGRREIEWRGEKWDR